MIGLVTPQLPASGRELRAQVRAFLAEERASGGFVPAVDSQAGRHSPEFSRRLGARGWIGMTWPKRYGGRERSQMERYVVIEELLAAGAPLGAHWTGDRQIGPSLLRFGTERQRAEYLPAISRGELYFALGISEPDAGSDLSAASTRAVRAEGGWRLTGRKIWTTHAHRAHYIVVLCRTSPRSEDRHAGFSQLIVDLASPGVTVRPIRTVTGEHTFGEVTFDDVAVPEHMVLGPVGNGWQQITAELANERSGPERILSTYLLLVELIRRVDLTAGAAGTEIGRLVSHLAVLRQLSLSVATMVEAGDPPDIAAALTKDLGTRFEAEVVRVARLLTAGPPGTPGLSGTAGREGESAFDVMLREATLALPSFTLRGGTTQILRSIIARRLGTS